MIVLDTVNVGTYQSPPPDIHGPIHDYPLHNFLAPWCGQRPLVVVHSSQTTRMYIILFEIVSVELCNFVSLNVGDQLVQGDIHFQSFSHLQGGQFSSLVHEFGDGLWVGCVLFA